MRHALQIALFLVGCSGEDWLRTALPEGAQDAERVFTSATIFSIPGCNVGAYKPRRPVVLPEDFIMGPIEKAVGEMSLLIRIIGEAEGGCASPVEFGFSRNGYYDFISTPNIQYKWDHGGEVVLFDPASGLFWVLRADT